MEIAFIALLVVLALVILCAAKSSQKTKDDADHQFDHRRVATNKKK